MNFRRQPLDSYPTDRRHSKKKYGPYRLDTYPIKTGSPQKIFKNMNFGPELPGSSALQCMVFIFYEFGHYLLDKLAF